MPRIGHSNSDLRFDGNASACPAWGNRRAHARRRRYFDANEADAPQRLLLPSRARGTAYLDGIVLPAAPRTSCRSAGQHSHEGLAQVIELCARTASKSLLTRP
jgi:hypothetical protein